MCTMKQWQLRVIFATALSDYFVSNQYSQRYSLLILNNLIPSSQTTPHHLTTFTAI
jgi:hypothetical protein